VHRSMAGRAQEENVHERVLFPFPDTSTGDTMDLKKRGRDPASTAFALLVRCHFKHPGPLCRYHSFKPRAAGCIHDTQRMGDTRKKMFWQCNPAAITPPCPVISAQALLKSLSGGEGPQKGQDDPLLLQNSRAENRSPQIPGHGRGHGQDGFRRRRSEQPGAPAGGQIWKKGN